MAEAKTVYFVFYMLVGVFSILMFAKMGLDWGTGKAIQRDYIALDTALTIDGIYAVSGDVEVNYILPGYRKDFASKAVDYVKGSKPDYEFLVKEGEIRLVPTLGQPSYASFVMDRVIAFDNQTFIVYTGFDAPLNIKKVSSGIYFNRFTLSTAEQIVLPKIDTKNLDWKENTLIFDGNADTQSILDRIIVQLGSEPTFKFIGGEAITDDVAENTKLKAEKYEDADMIIAIYYGNASKKTTWFFTNADPKSEKLAKSIMIGMVGNEKFAEFGNLDQSPKLDQEIFAQDYIDIIDIPGTAIFIELNIEEPSREAKTEFGNLIAKKIEEYYTR